MEQLRLGDPISIGAYRLEGFLGAGGMGEVFLGRSPGGRRFAIKVVRADIAADAQFRQRFRQEVEAARRIGGFWTAPVVDADPDAVRPWVASAYLDAPNLTTVIQRSGPLGEPDVRELGAGLAEALASVHQAGVVHRDLKPSNILITGDGPRIIDFGIAKAVGGTTHRCRQRLGYPGIHVARTSHRHRRRRTQRRLLLGAVLIYATTGRGPFGEGTVHTLLYRIVHDQPDLTRVPAGLRPALTACLSKHPQDRPTTGELLELLLGEGLMPLDSHTPPTPTAPATQPAPPPPPPHPGATTEPVPSPPPARTPASGQASGPPKLSRRRLVLGTLSAVVTMASGVLAVRAGFLSDDPPNLLFTLTGHTKDVKSVAFSPDGKTLASADIGAVRLWDIASRTVTGTLDSEDVSALSVAFSPDGRTLASGGGYPGAIDVWKPYEGPVSEAAFVARK